MHKALAIFPFLNKKVSGIGNLYLKMVKKTFC